jgi:ABC-type iron transport system FetAB permease component
MIDSPTLSWLNVGFGFLFILFDAILSATLGLGIGGSLVVAATRCVIQLSIMGLVLDKVFASDNIWGVIGIAREFDHQCIGWRLICSPTEPTWGI